MSEGRSSLRVVRFGCLARCAAPFGRLLVVCHYFSLIFSLPYDVAFSFGGVVVDIKHSWATRRQGNFQEKKCRSALRVPHLSLHTDVQPSSERPLASRRAVRLPTVISLQLPLQRLVSPKSTPMMDASLLKTHDLHARNTPYTSNTLQHAAEARYLPSDDPALRSSRSHGSSSHNLYVFLRCGFSSCRFFAWIGVK